MCTIAVAGGTGGVGRAIVEQLQLGGKHNFVVLGRKPPTNPAPNAATFLQVRYDDVDSLTKLLEDNGIQTVISALNLESEQASNSQINLIAAADKSRVTKRFIPSEFFNPIDKENIREAFGEQFRLASQLALEKSGLQYTRIFAGVFMDYWAMPHVHSYLAPFSPGIDMSLKKAVVPGSGNDVFTVTYSIDLARFIVRLLDEETWPKTAPVSGSDVTFNEVIALVEKTLGSKFEVIYDDVDKLKRGEATVLSSMDATDGFPEHILKQMTAEFGLMVVSGNCGLSREGRLNDQFPEIHVSTLEELLTKAWAGK
ncbi:NmrA-like family protein [Colletotrichum karsti]|uniref:NmrA-like family protein n=1 Tax=Colletotrichum karsti TaxID=1095194 RepID=A0A9P6HZ40_9PEZI|nr:NmrA-like family protein [Colletotrichum karsti]KAF9872797.1 NmrA-like family protein [Colletotrichum karsti]